LRNAERYKTPLAFFIFDIDNLKQINDTRGHPAGDDALRSFADVLRTVARRGDIAARYAGDEFVLVAFHAGHEAAEAVLGRLYPSLAKIELGCSTGVALFPDDAGEAQGLFAAADRALYQAKQAGKNCFRFAAAPA